MNAVNTVNGIDAVLRVPRSRLMPWLFEEGTAGGSLFANVVRRFSDALLF